MRDARNRMAKIIKYIQLFELEIQPRINNEPSLELMHPGQVHLII